LIPSAKARKANEATLSLIPAALHRSVINIPSGQEFLKKALVRHVYSKRSVPKSKGRARIFILVTSRCIAAALLHLVANRR
jgi:hypothetical protein